MTLFASQGPDRRPVRLDAATVPHEPSAAERAAAGKEREVWIDAALRCEITHPDRDWAVIDRLLDARNGEAELPLPQRHRSVPVIPGRN